MTRCRRPSRRPARGGRHRTPSGRASFGPSSPQRFPRGPPGAPAGRSDGRHFGCLHQRGNRHGSLAKVRGRLRLGGRDRAFTARAPFDTAPPVGGLAIEPPVGGLAMGRPSADWHGCAPLGIGALAWEGTAPWTPVGSAPDGWSAAEAAPPRSLGPRAFWKKGPRSRRPIAGLRRRKRFGSCDLPRSDPLKDGLGREGPDGFPEESLRYHSLMAEPVTHLSRRGTGNSLVRRMVKLSRTHYPCASCDPYLPRRASCRLSAISTWPRRARRRPTRICPNGLTVFVVGEPRSSPGHRRDRRQERFDDGEPRI